MSTEGPGSVTHGDVGPKLATLELCLPVIWTNTGPGDIVRNNGMSVISTPNIRDWESFKRDLFAPSEHSNNDLVAYIDSDDDVIPIESQCELDEALRIATNRAADKSQTKSLYLVVDRWFDPKSSNEKKNIRIRRPTKLTMPQTNLNVGYESFARHQPQNEINFNVKEPESSDDAAPKWFTSYMQAMKAEIVAEVSEKVTRTVMEALKKNRKNRSDPVNFHPRIVGLEYVLDTDSDDPRKKISLQDTLDDLKQNDSSVRSVSHNCENNSRRRHRNSEKQRKKYKSNISSRASNNFETSSQQYRDSTSRDSSPSNRRRKEKSGKKRESENSRCTMTQSMANNIRVLEDDSSLKNAQDPEMCDEGRFDTPYQRMLASGIRQMSFTPVDSTDKPEAPILKVRLSNSCENLESNVEEMSEEKLRMGCSVTGNGMFEETTNDRVPAYFAPSDSDNISIISGSSCNSYVKKMTNSFEMISKGSIKNLDETDDHRYSVTTEYMENHREWRVNDDAEGNRDSSSFELLSESASPSVSIHMDEDHFSPSKSETKSYNLNDNTFEEKQENRYKFISRPLVIDVEGKIYSIDIFETNDENSTERISEKRTDGNDSFVADNLPGSRIREKPDNANEETVTDSVVSETDTVKHYPNETNHDEKSSGRNCNEAFHESTQSFHSHTAPQAEKDRRNSASRSSFNGQKGDPRMSSSRIFVDRNASKGLGDTKQSSPRKQAFRDAERNESFADRRQSSRKQSNGTNRGFSTRESGNSCRGEGARIADEWSTDPTTIVSDILLNSMYPVQMFPFPIVNAVHAVTSACMSAHRVYDKIFTNSTRNRADKSKFGQR